jgi:hypothetical protein
MAACCGVLGAHFSHLVAKVAGLILLGLDESPLQILINMIPELNLSSGMVVLALWVNLFITRRFRRGEGVLEWGGLVLGFYWVLAAAVVVRYGAGEIPPYFG